MRKELLLLLALLGVGSVHAAPKCEADTFTEENSCVYGRGSIGMAGIGNQIISKDGQMFYHRMVMFIGGEPAEVERILFRIDGERTMELAAANSSRPDVNCRGRICTWNWSVLAPITAEQLAELGAAQSLVIGIEGEGRRVEEAEVKRGGRMFARFLADIQEHEPELLNP